MSNETSANVTSSSNNETSVKENHTMSNNFADRAAYVDSLMSGQQITATVIDSCKAGLMVKLSDNAPMNALLIGLSANEQETVLAAVMSGRKVTIDTVVLEADSRSRDSRGNYRCRLVVGLAKNELETLRRIELANCKPGDTFEGRPVKVMNSDKTGIWGLTVGCGRVVGLLHVNAANGRQAAIDEMSKQDKVSLTVLDVDAERNRLLLTNRDSDYVKSIHQMASSVGHMVNDCEVVGIKDDIAFIKVLGLTCRVSLNEPYKVGQYVDGKLLQEDKTIDRTNEVKVGDKVVVQVTSCNIERGSWNVELAILRNKIGSLGFAVPLPETNE